MRYNFERKRNFNLSLKSGQHGRRFSGICQIFRKTFLKWNDYRKSSVNCLCFCELFMYHQNQRFRNLFKLDDTFAYKFHVCDNVWSFKKLSRSLTSLIVWSYCYGTFLWNSLTFWETTFNLVEGIYLIKVNSINTRKRCSVCSKFTVKVIEIIFWYLYC